MRLLLCLPAACSALLAARVPRVVARPAAYRTPSVLALGVGDRFPTEQLGLPPDQRAVVTFIERDAGFACAKSLRVFADRTDAFASRGCTVTAVRPPEAAAPAEYRQQRFPGLEFHDDAGGALRGVAGLGPKGRTTFCVASNGTVCSVISNQVDASEHAAYALRALAALDAAEEAAEAAANVARSNTASNTASGTALRDLFAEATNTPPPSAEALGAAAAEKEAARQAALRQQAIFAKANWAAKFGPGGGRGGDRLAAETGAAAREAAQRARRARDAGDVSTEMEALEDARAAWRMQVEALAGDARNADKAAARAEDAAREAAAKARRARQRVAEAEEAVRSLREQQAMQRSLLNVMRQDEEEEAAEAEEARRAEADRQRLNALMLDASETPSAAPPSEASAQGPKPRGLLGVLDAAMEGSLGRDSGAGGGGGEPRWKAAWDERIGAIEVDLKAARTAGDGAVAAQLQEQLQALWSGLAQAKAAAREAEALAPAVLSAERRVAPLVETAAAQEVLAASAAARAADARKKAAEEVEEVERLRAQLRAEEASAARRGGGSSSWSDETDALIEEVLASATASAEQAAAAAQEAGAAAAAARAKAATAATPARGAAGADPLSPAAFAAAAAKRLAAPDGAASAAGPRSSEAKVVAAAASAAGEETAALRERRERLAGLQKLVARLEADGADADTLAPIRTSISELEASLDD